MDTTKMTVEEIGRYTETMKEQNRHLRNLLDLYKAAAKRSKIALALSAVAAALVILHILLNH
jgi:hypothetical protein